MSTIIFIIFAAKNINVMKRFTMKRVLATIFTVLLFLGCATVKDQTEEVRTISNIQDNSSKYCVFDQKGKKVTCVNRNIGKLVGEVASVGSESFVTRKNGKLITYDKNGKKINSRKER